MLLREACTSACTGVAMYSMYRLLSRYLRPPKGVDERELACRTCSAVHATVTGVTAVLTTTGVLPAAAGALCCAVSIGYFIHDTIVVLSMGTEANYAPILAHHVLCGGSMVAMLTGGARRWLWYANLLQWNECTIPIQFGCWLMEIYGLDAARPSLYASGRWLMAAAWVSMRLVLMGAFFRFAWADRANLNTTAKLVGCTIGPFLTAFNVGGLFKVVLPGCPWRPKPKQ